MNPKNTSRNFLVMVVMLAPLTLFGQKEVHKTFSGIKKINLTTASGNCHIKKSTDGTITIDLKHTYDDDEYTPVITQTVDRLVIEEKFHKNSSHGNADWTLMIPDNITIKITAASGDVDASGLVLDLDATTGSGDYIFKNVSGKIESGTGSGDFEFENVSGDVEATSGSGSFQVTKCKGNLELTSGSGGLKLTEVNAAMDITTGSGNISGNTITLDGPSGFTTGSGDTEISLAATPKHNISVTSGSGDAILNFNGNEVKGEIIMRASKKHGNIEAPFAFDKTEEIDQHENNVTIQKTTVKGSSTPRISISTGSGDAVLKQ